MLARLAILGVVLTACAAPPGVPVAPIAPIVIGQTFVLRSMTLNEDRVINVHLPPDYGKGETHYPVLFALDGGIAEDFLHVAGNIDIATRNAVITPHIVVGIENTERRRDLVAATDVPEEKTIAPHAGGTERFRQFLREELKPEIARRYRTTRESALVGESFAGLFVLQDAARGAGSLRCVHRDRPERVVESGRAREWRGGALHALDGEAETRVHRDCGLQANARCDRTILECDSRIEPARPRRDVRAIPRGAPRHTIPRRRASRVPGALRDTSCAMKCLGWVIAGVVLFGACAPSASNAAALSGCPVNIAWMYPALPTLNTALWQFSKSNVGRTVGTGECADVPELALRQYGGATFEDMGTTNLPADYIWGDLVEIVTPANPRFINVLPGDVIQYANADFKWQVGANAWETDVADHHTAVVSAVSADGANVCVFQQNSDGRRYVTYGFYEVAGMTSGVLHVYRPRPRSTPAQPLQR